MAKIELKRILLRLFIRSSPAPKLASLAWPEKSPGGCVKSVPPDRSDRGLTVLTCKRDDELLILCVRF